jgi:hypothetical protein
VGGLYPLPLDEIKQVCNNALSQINTWYSRLGHASRKVVERILRNNNLLSSQESVSHFVCDACQQAKSHQFPYSSSTSMSKVPLELIYSDVWGPAPESVGKKYMFSLLMILASLYGYIC